MATAIPVECPACFRRSLLASRVAATQEFVVCKRCGTTFRVPVNAVEVETHAPKHAKASSPTSSGRRRVPVMRGEPRPSGAKRDGLRRPGKPALPKSRSLAAGLDAPPEEAHASRPPEAQPSEVAIPARPRRRRPGMQRRGDSGGDAAAVGDESQHGKSESEVQRSPGRRHPALSQEASHTVSREHGGAGVDEPHAQGHKLPAANESPPEDAASGRVSDEDVPLGLEETLRAAAEKAEADSETANQLAEDAVRSTREDIAEGDSEDVNAAARNVDESVGSAGDEGRDVNDNANDAKAPVPHSSDADVPPPEVNDSPHAASSSAAATQPAGSQTGRIAWPELPEVEARQEDGEWEDSSDTYDAPQGASTASGQSSGERAASVSLSESMWIELLGFARESSTGEESQAPTTAGAAALDPFNIGPAEPSETSSPFGSSDGAPAVIDTGDLGFEDWTGTTFHSMNPATSLENDTVLAENVVGALSVENGFNPFLIDFAPTEAPELAAANDANGVEAPPEGPGPKVAEPDAPPATGSARTTGSVDRSKAMPSQRMSAVSHVGQAVRAAVAGMSRPQDPHTSARAPRHKSSRLTGASLGRVAEIEPPPTPKLINEAKPAPEQIPGPGGKLTLDGETYNVMDANEALERLLRTGDLPEYTYVHDLDLGYVPSDWNNPGNWHLRTPLHTRMVAQEEDFYIPRQGPNAPDCLAVLWPRRPLKIRRCAFGTLNLNRAAFPLGASIIRCKVLYRVAAVRPRFDGRADFAGTTLPMRSTFYQLHATGSVSFEGCRFEGSTTFTRAQIDGYTSFRKAEIHGDLDLSQVYVGAELDLREAIVLGQTRMRRIRVHAALDLGRAGLYGPLALTEAAIDGSLRADELACGSTATLERCRVAGDADFMQARFADTLGLAHVRLRGEARFGRCRFGALVDGYRMEVDGAFDLSEAVMHGDAVFATSRFLGLVRFNVDPLSRVRVELTQKAAEFRGLARFDHCVFSKPLVASATRFHGRVTFRRATFEESASFAEASFATGCDFSHAFAGKELDLRNVNVGGRLSLDGMHVGGRALLKGARFRALSLAEATLDVLTLERRQLYLDEWDLRDNYADPEVPPFKESERQRPVKLFHYRHAVMGPDPAVPGTKPQRLSKAQRREQQRARLRGGLDAQLKLESGGARLVAFDKAREEFALLKRSFHVLGQIDDEDWAFVLTRRMQRATWALAGRGIKPVDEALLAVEREISALEEMRELVDTEQVEHEKFPRELAQRREELLAREAANRARHEVRNGANAHGAAEEQGTSSAGWPRLKELTLKAIRARLEPLNDKRERILDRLRSLEVPRPRNEVQRVTIPLGVKARCATDTTMDVIAAYGTRPLRILAVALVVMALFALFYARHSYWEDAALSSESAARAEQRALQVEPAAVQGWRTEPAADPVGELSLGQRVQLYTLYSAGVMVGHGWRTEVRPRAGHWVMWLVVVQTVLGVTLMLLFIAAAVRRLLR